MIRKPSRQDATRLACGTLVAAASVFTAGVGFASSADAAATAITATPAQSNYAVNGTATINATVAGTPTGPILYTVTSGPDKSATNAGQPTTSNGNGSYTVSLKNNGGAGTDSVTVFDDVDKSGTLSTGDVTGSTTVTFVGGVASAPTLTPSSTTVSANNVETYTVSAKDTNGNPAAGAAVTISASETTSSATNPLAFSTTVSNPTTTDGQNTGTAASPQYAHTITGTVTLDGTGTAKVGITSTTAGTVSVKATATNGNGTFIATSSYTVTGGNTGAAAVSKLTVTPATATGSVNGTDTFTVTALDANGAPVSGVTINYLVTSGPDKTPAGTYPTAAAATTNTDGTAKVTIQNANTAGTDSVTFYVNETPTDRPSQGAYTPGLDAGEPSTTATANFVAQPAYDSITVTCNDQSVDSNGTVNGQQSSCTVPAGSNATTTFTVTVKEKNANGVEQPVSGATVNTGIYFLSNPANAATASPAQVVTGADGTATFTATAKTTVDQTYYYASAIVGNGSSYNGSGSATAYALVQYQTPTATNVVVSPANQSVQSGTSATVTAKVTDQFGATVTGNAAVTFTVTGRNGVSGTVNTVNGVATFTYSDTGSATTAGPDTITAKTSGGQTGTAKVNWVVSTAAAKVSLNLCDDTSAPYTDNETVGNSTACSVTATVTNSSGNALGGQSVTFTVDKGFVTASNVNNTSTAAAPTTKTITVTTDANGQATAYYGSTVSGTQAVTATDGAATASGAVTYFSDTATTVTLSPAGTASAPTSITAGSTQLYTATATDQFGNPVPGDDILFQLSGPGTVSGTSSTYVRTDNNGVASILVSTPTGASGSGTVTVDDTDGYNPTTKTDPTAVSYYTVTTTAPVTGAANVSVSGLKTVVVRNLETATATVTDASGKPVAGTVVSFTARGTQGDTGTGTTDSNGVASFTFRTLHAGDLTVRASAKDSSGSLVSGEQTVSVDKQAVNVTLQAVSTTKGTVTLTAYASPVTGVVPGATMGFYQANGNTYIGPARMSIGTNGGARIVLNRTSGTTYTFYATVVDSTDVTATASAPTKVRVR